MTFNYKTVSNRIVQSDYGYLLEQGVDEAAIYKKTGLRRANVVTENGRLGYHRYLAFLGFCYEMDTPLFSENIWNYSLSNMMEVFGEFIGLILNCKTAAEALCQHFRYRDIIGEPDYIVVKRESGKMIMQYIHDVVTPVSSVQACGNFVLIYKLLEFYNQQERVKFDVHLSGAPWLDPAEYEDFFKGTIRFNETFCRIEFDAALLEGNSTFYNPILSPYLEAKVKDEILQIQRSKLCYSTNVYSRVKELLLSIGRGDGFENLNVSSIGKELNMSRWTLQRKLGQEGVTFEKILSEIRREEAVKHLSESSLVIGDISDKLGFSSQGAFSRFFSQHFGMTPSEFRRAGVDWKLQT